MAAFGSNTKVVYQRDGGDVVLTTPNIVYLCTGKIDCLACARNHNPSVHDPDHTKIWHPVDVRCLKKT